MGFVADQSAGDLMTQRIIDDMAQSQQLEPDPRGNRGRWTMMLSRRHWALSKSTRTSVAGHDFKPGQRRSAVHQLHRVALVRIVQPSSDVERSKRWKRQVTHHKPQRYQHQGHGCRPSVVLPTDRLVAGNAA